MHIKGLAIITQISAFLHDIAMHTVDVLFREKLSKHFKASLKNSSREKLLNILRKFVCQYSF